MGICCDKDSYPVAESDTMMEEYTLVSDRTLRHRQMCATQYEFDRRRCKATPRSPQETGPESPGPDYPSPAHRVAVTKPPMPGHRLPPSVSVAGRNRLQLETEVDSDSSAGLYSPTESSFRCYQDGIDEEGTTVIHCKDLDFPISAVEEPPKDGHEDAVAPVRTKEMAKHPVKLTPRHVDCAPSSSMLPAEVPRSQQLSITCMNLKLFVKPKDDGKQHEARPKSKPLLIKNTWDFLGLPNATKELNEGNTYFRFVCKTAQNLEDSDMGLIRFFVNLSCFENEEIQNNVKRYNVDRDDAEFTKFRFVVVKTMYLLPGVRLEDISVERLCTVDYQRRCQPGKPKIWDDVTEPDVFRFTKSVIPLIFSMTMQFKVWEMDERGRQSMRGFNGQIPCKVLVMERTKRNKLKADSVTKLRTVLFYYEVPGGLLASMVTLVLNSTIPRVIAAIVHTFGGSGASEAAQTSDLTRGYFLKQFGDCRMGTEVPANDSLARGESLVYEEVAD